MPSHFRKTGNIMTFNLSKLGIAGAASALFAVPAWAQEAASNTAAAVVEATPAAAAAFVPTAEMVNKGDTAWMLISSALVLLMSVPALALFYGGLVRTKNMLSLLMQVFMIVSIAALVWVSWGYSMAFTGGSPYVGGFSKAFLQGVNTGTFAATFSNGVYLPEYAYVIFQMTFACITPALIVGAFAERVKFSALMIFVVAWLTIVYFPIAHMVWYFAGPDFLAPTVIKDAAGTIVSQDAGYLFGKGALDFAGGTVVHINAGIAGLVGCIMIGKRIGFGKEATPGRRCFGWVGSASTRVQTLNPMDLLLLLSSTPLSLPRQQRSAGPWLNSSNMVGLRCSVQSPGQLLAWLRSLQQAALRPRWRQS
jgi:ammonium transporter, Amt family